MNHNHNHQHKKSHKWMMIVCVAVMIGVAVTLSRGGLSLGGLSWGYGLLFILCPLIHGVMMFGMFKAGKKSRDNNPKISEGES